MQGIPTSATVRLFTLLNLYNRLQAIIFRHHSSHLASRPLRLISVNCSIFLTNTCTLIFRQHRPTLSYGRVLNSDGSLFSSNVSSRSAFFQMGKKSSNSTMVQQSPQAAKFLFLKDPQATKLTPRVLTSNNGVNTNSKYYSWMKSRRNSIWKREKIGKRVKRAAGETLAPSRRKQIIYVSLLCNECSTGPATTAGDVALPDGHRWPAETIKLALMGEEMDHTVKVKTQL